MSKYIKQEDLVVVLVNSYHPDLEDCKGVVQQTVAGCYALVHFVSPKSFIDADHQGTIRCMPANKWMLPFSILKVLDSPFDNSIQELEETIMSLEDDLLIARSCLGFSEELREQQEILINKMIEDIDILKKELYDARKGY